MVAKESVHLTDVNHNCIQKQGSCIIKLKNNDSLSQGTLQSNSSKLSTTVKFPLCGFDISEHVASKPNNTHTNSTTETSVLGGVWSPWKRPKRLVHHSEDSVYDLHAVCYHHGKDMQGGHYTGKFHEDNTYVLLLVYVVLFSLYTV